MLFESKHKVSNLLGMSVTESLVTLKNGAVVLPIENYLSNIVYPDAGVELSCVWCRESELECSNQPVKE